MKYCILFNETDHDFGHLRAGDTEEGKAYWASWFGYFEALGKAGIETSGAALQPPENATTVRLREGQRLVQDGPFAEVKEQLGGFFMADFPDLDTALEWAAKAPCAATGSVEVRPVLPVDDKM